VVWSATYDSFGNAGIGIQGITNNLRFPGQYYDSETGLHYNLNRYYDPSTGRYLRTDPYGQGLNLYAYCFNNPLTLIDPRGLCIVNTVGYYLGTGLGEESAIMWADWYNQTGNPMYFLMGCFASLWTPDTYIQTALTLATAPLAAAEIAVAGVRSTVAAARVAAKQVAEELIGLPLPTKPKFLSRSGGQIFEGSTWDKIPITPKNVAYRYVGSAEARIAESTQRVPNVKLSGEPKNVFYSPQKYTSATEAEAALRIGRQNPISPTATPTHRITVDATKPNWTYGGNVEGGTGTELITRDQLPVLRIDPLGG
jgi:RHS repeat-associated protein